MSSRRHAVDGNIPGQRYGIAVSISSVPHGLVQLRYHDAVDHTTSPVVVVVVVDVAVHVVVAFVVVVIVGYGGGVGRRCRCGGCGLSLIHI